MKTKTDEFWQKLEDLIFVADFESGIQLTLANTHDIPFRFRTETDEQDKVYQVPHFIIYVNIDFPDEPYGLMIDCSEFMDPFYEYFNNIDGLKSYIMDNLVLPTGQATQWKVCFKSQR